MTETVIEYCPGEVVRCEEDIISPLARRLYERIESIRGRAVHHLARQALWQFGPEAWARIDGQVEGLGDRLPPEGLLRVSQAQERLMDLLPYTGHILMGSIACRAPDDFLHQLRVGAAMMQALQESPIVQSLPPSKQEDLMDLACVSGCLHDCGKEGEHTGLGLGSDDKIRRLLAQPRMLTRQEREMVAAHAPYGAERLCALAQQFEDGSEDQRRLMEAAVIVGNHHGQASADMSDDARMIHPLLKCCDIADAATEPVVGNRAYIMDRMLNERMATLSRHPSGMYVFTRALEPIRESVSKCGPSDIAGLKATEVADIVFALKGFTTKSGDMLREISENVPVSTIPPSGLASALIYNRWG